MIVIQDILRIIFSTFFIYVGITHFTNPSIYDALVPTYLPNPRIMHLLAGAVEVILGISLLTKWKSEGALLLAIFLVVVYLGNLHMWINNIPFMKNYLSLFLTAILFLPLSIISIIFEFTAILLKKGGILRIVIQKI